MPTKSSFRDVEIPDIDLWTFLFERKNRGFSDDSVIYRSCNADRKYNFTEVREAARAFGQGLRDQWNWQRNEVLNIYAPNDIDVGPIIFGTFFAGGIVSPANPAYSPDELAFQLENSGSKAVVTTKGFLDAARKATQKVGIPDSRIILLGEAKDSSKYFKHWTEIKTTGQHYDRRRPERPTKDLAFLVYSSGTTGLPKGVMLSHTNIIANLCQIEGSVGHSYQPKKDKILGVLPFFHIYGLTGLVHQPLHRGIELVVMPGFDLPLFLKSIQSHRITFIYVAPPVIVRLARDPTVKDYDLSSVRMITSGAAPLTRELVDTVHKKFGISINQAYGLSESSPMSHTQPWDDWYSSVGSVGKIFPNMTAKYMSEDGHTELPAGEAGELWMAGPNIFLGYWKNQTATDHAITHADGLRYFKTGDVGFQDEQHNFYITDRVKELIKYKGFQVAPAELEGKLMDHPLVDDVAVIGVEDRENHTEVPRAYVVHAKRGKDAGDAETGRPTQQSEGDARDIVDWIAGKVAHHKRLRGGVRFIEEIPKSASGKILRRVLKDRVKREESGSKSKL